MAETLESLKREITSLAVKIDKQTEILNKIPERRKMAVSGLIWSCCVSCISVAILPCIMVGLMLWSDKMQDVFSNTPFILAFVFLIPVAGLSVTAISCVFALYRLSDR